MRRGIENIDRRQTVAAADFKIVEVVRRRDLHRARTLFRIGIFVRDNWNAAPDQRQDRRLADQLAKPLVFGMHCDSDVAEHGLRPRRGDGNEVIATLDRIFDVPELALGLDLLHFKV